MRTIFGALTLALCLVALGLFIAADLTGHIEHAMEGICLLLLAIPVMFMALPNPNHSGRRQ